MPYSSYLYLDFHLCSMTKLKNTAGKSASGTLTSRRLMMTAMAASSLPSLEAEEEGGLFFLALRAPCMIWSLKVMFPEFVPLVLLLF